MDNHAFSFIWIVLIENPGCMVKTSQLSHLYRYLGANAVRGTANDALITGKHLPFTYSNLDGRTLWPRVFGS